MDKWIEVDNGMDFLNIKTGINLYRCVTIVLFGLFMICGVLFLIYNKILTQIIITFLLSFSFLLLTIFMDKLVYIFKLPTNNLLIYKNKIIYVAKNTKFIFEINKINYEFHSFFEDFQTLSQLKISDSNNTYYFLITKRQFELIEKFLHAQ